MPSIAALAQALAPGVLIERGAGKAAVGEDTIRLDRLLARRREGDDIRLWTNQQCLVTTRRFSRMEGFAAAAAASAADGWPVCVRASGGTTVAHRPGMLNVSRYETWPAGCMDVVKRFEEFSTSLVKALRAFGIPATARAIDGSHCDGRFNIAVGRKKIAGTACLLRQCAGWSGLLTHATIWVDGDIRQDILAICRFERLLGLAPTYIPDAHICLSDWLVSMRYEHAQRDVSA